MTITIIEKNKFAAIKESDLDEVDAPGATALLRRAVGRLVTSNKNDGSEIETVRPWLQIFVMDAKAGGELTSPPECLLKSNGRQVS